MLAAHGVLAQAIGKARQQHGKHGCGRLGVALRDGAQADHLLVQAVQAQAQGLTHLQAGAGGTAQGLGTVKPTTRRHAKRLASLHSSAGHGW